MFIVLHFCHTQVLLAAGVPPSDINYLTSGFQAPNETPRVRSQPLSLKFLSRIAIRRALHRDMRTKAQSLPLPQLLRNFVLLQEFV